MRFILILTLLAFCAAELAEFHKFAASFFTAIGLTEDIKALSEKLTETEEQVWVTIHKGIESIKWNNTSSVVAAVKEYTRGLELMLGRVIESSKNIEQISKIMYKIIAVLRSEANFVARVTKRIADIEKAFKLESKAIKEKDMEKAGEIGGEFVKSFYLT
eukprot:TRINITY_DN10307_c0_g2_i3.p2 TRINITY_DN10307_c0_g2~~TRINITY_DN10307_c0_g2_i3.p2  ORF type:complete len:160 (-),score=28.80 TRINITY_DN10307_c0_g2_i3:253-732(-)